MFPRRFILSGSQMSEGFAAAECFPAHSEFFAGLTVARGVLPPLLAGAGEIVAIEKTDHRAVLDHFPNPHVGVIDRHVLTFVEGQAEQF